jgi:glycosyltransferase involved in cell wall biosynthesis
MRIVHVAPTQFGPAGLFGGGERYPLELARALARDVDCSLVTFGPAPCCYREPGSSLRVRVLQARAYMGGHPAHPIAPGLPAALAGADLVHTHHLRSLPSRVAAVTARLLNRKVVVTDHGLQGGDWLGLLPGLMHRFLTVSAYSARELCAPPERTTIIYGGADPHRYAPDPDVRRDGVLFVGRITPHKGIDLLIKALPPGARLLIAGSGGHDPELPERDYPILLRRLAEGKEVQFLGPLPDSAMPALYRQAAVLVLPSVDRTCYGKSIRVSELLGLVALEAMASGTPVVCSSIGGLPEVVQHGVTGYLVRPGNAEELRERLSQLLCDRALAHRLGRNARDRVLDRFTWQDCAHRCLRVYEDLLH